MKSIFLFNGKYKRQKTVNNSSFALLVWLFAGVRRKLTEICWKFKTDNKKNAMRILCNHETTIIIFNHISYNIHLLVAQTLHGTSLCHNMGNIQQLHSYMIGNFFFFSFCLTSSHVSPWQKKNNKDNLTHT